MELQRSQWTSVGRPCLYPLFLTLLVHIQGKTQGTGSRCRDSVGPCCHHWSQQPMKPDGWEKSHFFFPLGYGESEKNYLGRIWYVIQYKPLGEGAGQKGVCWMELKWRLWESKSEMVYFCDSATFFWTLFSVTKLLFQWSFPLPSLRQCHDILWDICPVFLLFPGCFWETTTICWNYITI